MRLIYDNFSQQQSTVVGKSSESIYFPASNIKHEFRSKEWRSSNSGYFKVNGSTSIEFTDSTSATHTVSISAGVYSASTLATEIKAKLESATSQDFTVFKSDTSGLWTIESDLDFSLHNTSSSFLFVYCGFDSSDYSGSNEYTGSRIAIHTEEFLTFDLRTTEEIDSVVMLWPKGKYKLSQNAEIYVQGNATNEWSSPAFNQLMTVSEDYETTSLYLTNPESYRYWRVKIVDAANPCLYVSLGVLILGKAETLQNPDNGFTWNISDTSNVTSNDFGNTWVDEFPQLNTLSMNFNLLDYEVAEALEKMFKVCGNRKPVFIALEESGTVFNKDNYAIYGKFGSSFGLNHIMYKYLSSALTITEVL